MSSKKNIPFSWNNNRISKSPFKNLQDAKSFEKKFLNGQNIGFTRISSLKSMGRIPRSHGKYELGDKYK